MQSVEEPALDAGEPVLAGDHPAECWIDVDPGLHGIAELDAHHRQRRLPFARVAARVVVGVVVGQQLGLDHRHARNRRRQPLQQRLGAERLLAQRQRIGRDEQRPRQPTASVDVRPAFGRNAGRLLRSCSHAHGVVGIVLDAQQLDLLDRLSAGDALPCPAVHGREAREVERTAGQCVARDVEAAGVVPGVGIHRQQAAEDPGQGDESENDARQVVPAHPARVRDPRPDTARGAVVSTRQTPAELGDAQHQPDDGEQAAESRRPDHDVVPERLVRAQRGEVDPVRNRAHPRQRPAAPRGQHRHLGRPRRDVELGAGVVVDCELVQRKLAPLDQRPLIGLRKRASVVDGTGWAAGEPTRDRGSRGRPHLAETLPGVGEHGHAVEPVGRPVHDRQQRGALGGRRHIRPPGRRGRGQHDAIEVQRGQSFEPQLRRQARHVSRVHHHDAGGEPDHEEGAEGNAQVAVDQDQPAYHCL